MLPDGMPSCAMHIQAQHRQHLGDALKAQSLKVPSSSPTQRRGDLGFGAFCGACSGFPGANQ